ncbi:hypothetical protein EV379_1888 [Microterricola gilva]|uniref:DUF559 domain-containing protein n=1 Tax=Microterricola gilva TaxID=393267 RepID=A0A4Q8ALX3_9MICO|nr:hypothetical protein [Microterricola gilva]RZU65554.1 hypothetical protein EV379_1888 [Microterricola gilva]
MNTPLPRALRVSGFRVAEAQALGVGLGRLRSADLARPFHGVRSLPTGADPLLARIDALRTVLPDAAFFTHQTAALLYGAPLPLAFEGGPLHVAVVAPLHPSRRSGVVWHESSEPIPLRQRGTLLAAAPARVWCQLAGLLSLYDLVAVGDYFVTGDHPIRPGRAPLCTLAELRDEVARYGSRRNARVLRQALSLVRYGPLSRPESHTRLVLIGAGLPEPALNFEVAHPVRHKRYILDLAYPELRLGLDYEGDHHRSDAAQFRKDIRRREELAELDWTDIRVTADDLEYFQEDLITRVTLHRERALARD